jgi:glutamate/tyrosine decarboxylase-like PLP-dependent enzyme
MAAPHPFPPSGRSADDLLGEIGRMREGDLDWRSGRAFSLVYDVDDPELEELLERVGVMFLHENALNPFRYETLLRMETEVIGAAVDLFGAGCGSLSSGGTESIFLAVHTARQWGRERGIDHPRLVCADTAHPAFAKACHYLGVQMVQTAHGPDGRAQPELFEQVLDGDTVLVVASSPCYPFGVIDPVERIAAVARDAGVLCHVDACLGGWLLPWWEQLGRPVPPWNFVVDGVTSLSADIHKYGYCYKGVSTVLYRDRELLEHQIFMYDSWPGGLYASSSAAGTRPGAPIAGAWTVIHHLGAEGYLRLARRVLDATERFRDGIAAIDGLRITSDPDLSLFEFGPEEGSGIDIDGVCDVMDERGWNLDRQQGGLHLMVSPGHDRVVDRFCEDLAAAVAGHGPSKGGDHVYGGVV